jgi:type I thyroxine 5'-deiodinase
MASRYGDQMAFYLVYIQEAHASDGWQVGINEEQRVVYEQPKSADEREAVADACVLSLNISIPTLLDDMSNDVDRAYAALPDRLYLVGPDGRILYRSDPGPWGFKPDELEAAITGMLEAAGDS